MCLTADWRRHSERRQSTVFPRAYASGMELIADPDIDIILNLTTPQAHYEYNLAALKAGKHVYTEKPLAMTFEPGQGACFACQGEGTADWLCAGHLSRRPLAEHPRADRQRQTGPHHGRRAWFVGHGHEFHHPAPAFFYQPAQARCTIWGRTTSPRCSACSAR